MHWIGFEGIGCALFVRSLLRYRGAARGTVAAYQALAWNLGVWFAVIAGTEFFVAYPSESPFRELFGSACSWCWSQGVDVEGPIGRA